MPRERHGETFENVSQGDPRTLMHKHDTGECLECFTGRQRETRQSFGLHSIPQNTLTVPQRGAIHPLHQMRCTLELRLSRLDKSQGSQGG